MKHIRSFALLPAALALTACATIVGSPHQLVPIGSTPTEASIVIADETGKEMFKGVTPTTVTLPKSTGSYWGKKSYTVTISKAGFKPQVIPVTASANGWYLAGNFIFGGLIGWFVVDPLGGHMYTLSPEAVSATLQGEAAAHNNRAADGSISVVLLQDVPAALRSRLVQVQ